jgi:hypothetical protein
MRTTLGRWFKRLCVRHAGIAVALLVAGALGWLLLDGHWDGKPGSAWLWIVVPTVVAGLAVDMARWRIRVCQNRERQRIFRFLNDEMVDDKSRLLQRLLDLRHRVLEADGFEGLVFDHLDRLIVDQHRHLLALRDRAVDSDRMAPLLTGVYTEGFRETTWTASLHGEFEASRSAR